MSQEKIELNVGGTIYTTTVSTLTREPNSMLGRMFSAKWQPLQQLQQDPGGNRMRRSGSTSTTSDNLLDASSILNESTASNALNPPTAPPVFIDADGTHFRYILNYLRRGEHVFLPNNADILDELLVEANYFHLDGLVHLITGKLTVLRPERFLALNVGGAGGAGGPGGAPDDAAPDPHQGWVPQVGETVKWRADAIEGYWRSVSVAVASFHYQGHQDGGEAVCGFMHKTKFLPDDMEVFFLRCVSCRASTRVGEVWRYDLDSLKSIKAVMPTLAMRVVAAPAAINHIVSSDCVSVNWSATMVLHVSKSALTPVSNQQNNNAAN